MAFPKFSLRLVSSDDEPAVDSPDEVSALGALDEAEHFDKWEDELREPEVPAASSGPNNTQQDALATFASKLAAWFENTNLHRIEPILINDQPGSDMWHEYKVDWLNSSACLVRDDKVFVTGNQTRALMTLVGTGSDSDLEYKDLEIAGPLEFAALQRALPVLVDVAVVPAVERITRSPVAAKFAGVVEKTNENVRAQVFDAMTAVNQHLDTTSLVLSVTVSLPTDLGAMNQRLDQAMSGHAEAGRTLDSGINRTAATGPVTAPETLHFKLQLVSPTLR